MKVILPPDSYTAQPGDISLFLGGSIELGKAEDWQKALIHHLSLKPYADRLVIFNPRNENWDATIPTEDPDHPAFKRQVEWELKMQDKADILLYYCAGNTISPITLLEMGAYSARKPIIGADPTYKRYGNVVITARHFGWNMNMGWDAFVATLDRALTAAVAASKAS